jgi:hypothetical protein
MTTFELSHFDDFLTIAIQQSEPQKLLLVLTKRELPHGHTEKQAQMFAQGHGGHLAPLAGIDKQLSELESFSSLVKESEQIGSEWDAVFVAALPGAKGKLPTPKEIDDAIEKMIHAIRNGMISNFLAFNRDGIPLHLNHD